MFRKTPSGLVSSPSGPSTRTPTSSSSSSSTTTPSTTGDQGMFGKKEPVMEEPSPGGKLSIKMLAVKGLRPGQEFGVHVHAVVSFMDESGKETACLFNLGEERSFLYNVRGPAGDSASPFVGAQFRIDLFLGSVKDVKHRFGSIEESKRMMGRCVVPIPLGGPIIKAALENRSGTHKSTYSVLRKKKEAVCDLELLVTYRPEGPFSPARSVSPVIEGAKKGFAAWANGAGNTANTNDDIEMGMAAKKLGAIEGAIEAKAVLKGDELVLFNRYDKKAKGHLTPLEFRTFVRDMQSLGVSVEILTAHDKKKGCCGKLVRLPGEPLFSYVTHNHSLLVVIYGYGPFTTLTTNVFDRSMLIVMVFFYSVGLTCVITRYFNELNYAYRILIQSGIDVAGVTIIKLIFALTHKKSCHWVIRFAADILMALALLGACAYVYLAAENVLEGSEIIQTFLPNWLAGRFTEMLQVASLWAFKVQYGSSRGTL